MKKTFLILTAVGLLGGQVSWAMPEKISFQDGPGTGGGGEFKATIWDIGPNPDVPLMKWNTFCLERSIRLGFTLKYDFTIDPERVYAGGPDGGADPAPGDPISIGTAFLYSQFLNHTLPYAYGNPVQRETDATFLQVAIWWLEDEVALTATQQANNPFLAYANNQLPGGMADLKSNNNGQYPVDVVNVWYYSDTQNPDRQSVLIGLPDGGATLFLLGLGISGLAFLRRKH